MAHYRGRIAAIAGDCIKHPVYLHDVATHGDVLSRHGNEIGAVAIIHDRARAKGVALGCDGGIGNLETYPDTLPVSGIDLAIVEHADAARNGGYSKADAERVLHFNGIAALGLPFHIAAAIAS
jgi:hypothetical protein